MSRKKDSNVFRLSGGRNESKSHELARVGEMNIFDNSHEKVGFKRFCAQEAEMSLTAMSMVESARRKFFMNLLESARRQFFMNSTCIMSRK